MLNDKERVEKIIQAKNLVNEVFTNTWEDVNEEGYKQCQKCSEELDKLLQCYAYGEYIKF